MNDKEMIEEMARVLHDRIINKTWRAKKVAKELYEIIIPKDSVVLSREEYEELRQNLDKLRQTERANILAEIADGGTSCHWCEEENQKIGYEKGSKETAEKIYNFVERYIMDDAEVELMVKEWFEKQFSVEIKE